jgi:hypothetical protein
MRRPPEARQLQAYAAGRKAAGYCGYYWMESDSDVDPFVDTRHLIQQTLSLI